MNILVTGADGQLGQAIRSRINEIGNGEPHHYVGDKNYYLFANKNELDITDKNACINFVKEHSISIIINCAAYTNVDKAEDNKDLAYSINCQGAKNLAISCLTHGALLIHISTDYVFNETQPIALLSNHTMSPINIYGESKKSGELEIIGSGCKYLIFRTSWLYGGKGKSFLNTIYNLLTTRETINVINDQYGSPTNVHDFARFLVHIIEDYNSDNLYLNLTNIYHFSNKGITTWYSFANKIKEELIGGGIDIKCEIKSCTSEEYPQRAARPKYSILDCSNTEEDFNWKIDNWEISLKNNIKKFLIDA